MGLSERDPGLQPSTWGPSLSPEPFRSLPGSPHQSSLWFAVPRSIRRKDRVLASSLLGDSYPENESADGGD